MATSSPTRVPNQSLSPMASSLASASRRSLAGALPKRSAWCQNFARRTGMCLWDATCGVEAVAERVLEHFSVRIWRWRSRSRRHAGPWHLAMSSAGLLLLEIGFGIDDRSEEMKAKALCVEEDHVLRAYELLVLFLGVREIWHVLPAPTGAGDGQKDIAKIPHAIAARPSHSADLYEDWVPTQQVSAPTGTALARTGRRPLTTTVALSR